MKRWIQVGFIGLVGVLIQSCSLITGDNGPLRDRSFDYKQAQSIEPIRLPVELYSNDRVLALPELVSHPDPWIPTESNPVPRAQLVVNSQFGGSLQLRQFEQAQWIWSDQSMAQLSKIVRLFMKEEGLPEDRSQTRLGQLQTSWLSHSQLQVPSSVFKRVTSFKTYKGRIFFEVRPAETVGAFNIVCTVELVQWLDGQAKPLAGDKTVSQQIAVANQWNQRLYDYMAVALMPDPAEQLANQREFDVTLIQDGNGYPVMTIDQDFIVSWELVGQALRNLKVDIEDLDRSLAIYFIRIASRSDPQLVEQVFELHFTRSEYGSQVTLAKDQDTLAPIEISQVFFEALYQSLQQQAQPAI